LASLEKGNFGNQQHVDFGHDLNIKKIILTPRSIYRPSVFFRLSNNGNDCQSAALGLAFGLGERRLRRHEPLFHQSRLAPWR
jgi:hypothetical protein